MKKKFFLGILGLIFLLTLRGVKSDIDSKKNIENIVQQNVISAKYDNGFIVFELEDSETNYSNIEKYDIAIVKKKYIKEEKSYVKKYFNGYGRLLKIELFYNDSIL